MNVNASDSTPRQAFTGECREAGTCVYVLGERLYVATLRRLASPDRSSPFDNGGMNRYAYCGGEPIGRVDPSGEAWWDWLIAGVGLVAAVAGTIATGGTLAGALGAAAAGSLTASMSTASTVGIAAAATADVAAVGVELGSVVAMATGNDELRNVLGWVAIGTDVASLGLSGLARTAGRWARAAASNQAAGTRSRARSWSGLKRRWANDPADQPLPPVVRGREIRGWDRVVDDASILTGGRGEQYMEPAWYPLSRPSRYPGAVHFGADSMISAYDVKSVVQRNAARYQGPISVYSGAHGRADGQNWRLGGRRNIAADLMADDMHVVSSATDRLEPGRVVRFVNFADMTPATAMMSFAEPGLHIHATCYGAVDEVLLSMFRHAPVPVYQL